MNERHERRKKEDIKKEGRKQGEKTIREKTKER